jgi:hypothetical protein
VGKVIQVWVGRGGVVGGVVVKAAGVWGVVYKVGKCRAEPGFGPTLPLQWWRRCAWPHPAKYIAGWGPSRLGVGAGWVEVALARCQTMGRPYLDDAA